MTARRSVNYYVGGAMLVRDEAERIARAMNDLILYLRQDDGHGLGALPRTASTLAAALLKRARELDRELTRDRAHFYRNAALENPRRRRGAARCAECGGRDAFIRVARRDLCPVCALPRRPKRRRRR